ncbi:hypothetical protein T459_25288 [Capsicum annuum]|uniref:Uncharacterized protein n=1 Tax=Capsicum annuum TaxID=4072 RepID=A0A2G2YKC0_CAPAN|nr:putative UDP-glycosyltransferase 85A2-like [Capsicum annuum]PHT70184.1 hypothetical protein T459_25288 [Capsicum annuum]
MRWNRVDVSIGNQFEALEDIEKNEAEVKEKSTIERKNTMHNEKDDSKKKKGQQNTNHSSTPIRKNKAYYEDLLRKSAISGLNKDLAASEDDLKKVDEAAKELESFTGAVDLAVDLDKL